MAKIDTLCVHAGYAPAKGEPRQIPIVQSTPFRYENSDQMARLFDLEESGYFYSRLQNPTVDKVAAKIAALEGGVGALLTSSGQAANLFAVVNLCKAGDHIVCANNIYGGTFNLFGATLANLGIGITFVSHQIGGFMSSWLGGIFITQSGNYQAIWMFDIALCAIAALASYGIHRDVKRLNETF